MKKKGSTRKYWLLAVILLMGLGIAMVGTTMARAQRLLISEGLVSSSLETSPAKVDRQSLAVDSNKAPSSVNGTSVTFTLDVAAGSSLTGVF